MVANILEPWESYLKVTTLNNERKFINLEQELSSIKEKVDSEVKIEKIKEVKRKSRRAIRNMTIGFAIIYIVLFGLIGILH